MPEAPIGALAADAERLAKGWLVAVIEQRPLAEAAGILAGEWAADGPRVCEALVRSLGSDQALEGLRRPGFAGLETLDALRAVVWSALRAAWAGAQPDQVWDLGERLGVAIEVLRGPEALLWPGALERAIAAAPVAEGGLALVIAELVDADRVFAVEPADEYAAVLGRFREAVRAAAGSQRLVVDDGEARVCVIAGGADRAQALALGARIGEAVRGATGWRGAPLTGAVGVAMLGEDGDDAAALIAAAEEAMFAAAAAGIEITRGAGPEPGVD